MLYKTDFTDHCGPQDAELAPADRQGVALSDAARAVLSEALACIGNLPDGPSDQLRRATVKAQIRAILAIRPAPQTEATQGFAGDFDASEQHPSERGVSLSHDDIERIALEADTHARIIGGNGYNAAKYAIEKALSRASSSRAEVERYRHKKSDGIYEVLVPLAYNEADQAKLVVYRSEETGFVWVRPHGEFHDKFVLAAAEAPKAEVKGQ